MKISSPGFALAIAAPVTQAFGDVAAVGTGATAARSDHKHGMPTQLWTPVVSGTIAAAAAGLDLTSLAGYTDYMIRVWLEGSNGGGAPTMIVNNDATAKYSSESLRALTTTPAAVQVNIDAASAVSLYLGDSVTAQPTAFEVEVSRIAGFGVHTKWLGVSPARAVGIGASWYSVDAAIARLTLAWTGTNITGGRYTVEGRN